MRLYMFMLRLVTSVSLFGFRCLGLESPEPEVLLQPRNFNPHPYNEGGRVPPAIQSIRHIAPPASEAQARTGPVLFPANPEEARSNGADRGHPYATIARRQKVKFGGRFALQNQENNINPRVYSGLANYAAKVLKKPATTAQHNGFPDLSLAGHKKNYAFSYTVRDQETGDDFSHSQSQNAAATNGEYRVKLPDGRVQIVSYTADNEGYKANVKYADDEDSAPHQQSQPQIAYRPQQPVQQQPTPQQSVGGHILVPSYEYYDDVQQPHEQVRQLEVPVPEYDDNSYQSEYVSIYPEKIPSQYLSGDKVHIYPNSNGEQKVLQIGGNIQSVQKLGHIHAPVQIADKYTSIGDALVPYPNGNILPGSLRTAVSTASPPHYNQVYISSPKYSLVHTTPHPATSTPSYYKRR